MEPVQAARALSSETLAVARPPATNRGAAASRGDARWPAFVLLGLAVGGAFLLELMIGSARVPLGEVVRFLLGGALAQPAWETILFELRLPRALTALLCGSALGAAGLQLQTLFRNPLAGPARIAVSIGPTGRGRTEEYGLRARAAHPLRRKGRQRTKTSDANRLARITTSSGHERSV